MAIVIPFLIASTATGASIAAAIGIGASTLATITSVAFAVTGISAKINQAASNVFGEDLVNAVNLAGAVVGAWNGGFDLSGGESVSSAMLADKAAAEVSDQALTASATAPAAEAALSTGAPAADIASTTLTQPLPSIERAPFNLAEAAATPAVAPVAATNSAVAEAVSQTPAGTGLTSRAFGDPTKTLYGAPQAAAATSPYSITAAPVQTAALSAQQVAPSFFDKLQDMATSPQGAGAIAGGLERAYTGNQARKQQQAQYDQVRDDRNRRSRIGTFSLKG